VLLDAVARVDYARGCTFLGYVDLSVSQLSLSSAESQSAVALSDAAPSCFFNIVTPSRTFVLCTDTPAERTRWVEHLSKYCQQQPPSDDASSSSSGSGGTRANDDWRSGSSAQPSSRNQRTTTTPLRGSDEALASLSPTSGTSLSATSESPSARGRSLIGQQRPGIAIQSSTTAATTPNSPDSPTTSPRGDLSTTSSSQPGGRTAIKRELSILRGEILTNHRPVVDYIRDSEFITGTLIVTNYRVIFLPDARVCRYLSLSLSIL